MQRTEQVKKLPKTELVKRAMDYVFTFDPELMVEAVKGDKEYKSHYLTNRTTHQVTLLYKYTVTCEQIEELKEKIEGDIVVLIRPNGPRISCVSPYMEVTVCYRV